MPRVLLPLALGTALALTSTVSAGPASCRMIVDPAGDDRLYNVGAPPPGDVATRDSDLDIVGGDLATNKEFVTAVVRTRTQRGPSGTDSPAGRMWVVFFTVGEQKYEMAAAAAADGTDGIVYRITGEYGGPDAGAMYGEGIGPAWVSFDTKRNEVRITAPLSHFAPYTSISKGKVLRDPAIMSFRFNGTGGQRISLPANYVVDWGHGGTGHSVDSAESKRTYPVGAKSCVTPGR